VSSRVDWAEAGIGECQAERPELLARVGLELGVGERPPVGVFDALAEDLLKASGVGHAEGPAEVARRDHAGPGEHADAHGEAVIVARELGRPVLGRRRLALAHLEANVGVVEVRESARVVGREAAYELTDAVDQVDAEALGHPVRGPRTARPRRCRRARRRPGLPR
jgi:hypothetical protein